MGMQSVKVCSDSRQPKDFGSICRQLKVKFTELRHAFGAAAGMIANQLSGICAFQLDSRPGQARTRTAPVTGEGIRKLSFRLRSPGGEQKRQRNTLQAANIDPRNDLIDGYRTHALNPYIGRLSTFMLLATKAHCIMCVMDIHCLKSRLQFGDIRISR